MGTKAHWCRMRLRPSRAMPPRPSSGGPLRSLGPEARRCSDRGRKGGVVQQRSVVSVASHSGADTSAWSAPLCEECWRVGVGRGTQGEKGQSEVHKQERVPGKRAASIGLGASYVHLRD